jgi:hypothetical protein
MLDASEKNPVGTVPKYNRIKIVERGKNYIPS